MKGFTRAALAAILVAGAAAQPHVHKHRHAKSKKHEHAVVEKRDAVTVTSVVPATVTEYVLDGVVMDASQAEQGIQGGDYIVVGSSNPTFTPPPAPSSTSTTASSSSTEAAQFIELKSSSSTPAPESTPEATPTTAQAAAATGIDVAFPTGDDAPSCDVFPSAYGAVPVSWLGTDGWSSLQQPQSGFTLGSLVSNIVAPTSGGCQSGMFCSYACPPGYEKSQWPVDSQGSSGQSVGGLWCDENNKLQLTRPDHPYICEQGAGGVSVKNSLTSQVAVCRTDYPGSESMVIPLSATPGGTFPLTNPNSANYYVWEGKPTTAQYYVNPSGLSVEDACVWTSPTNPDSAGNWAPMNIGVGQDSTGTTYLSIFNNSPTSSATLNFNVRITGDVSIECTFENGAYTSGDGNGCTTAISSSGGQAVIEFY